MLLIKEINMQRGHNKAAKRVLEAQVMYLRSRNKLFDVDIPFRCLLCFMFTLNLDVNLDVKRVSLL